MIDDPPGMRNYWSAEYLAELDDDAMATFLKAGRDMPAGSRSRTSSRGAVPSPRVTDADTPMTNRDAAWVFHPFGVWEVGRATTPSTSPGRRTGRRRMRKHATGGIYLNFIGDEGQDRVRAAYGEKNYDRLAEIKRKYDPDNVFHRNQNIKPAVRAGT